MFILWLSTFASLKQLRSMFGRSQEGWKCVHVAERDLPCLPFWSLAPAGLTQSGLVGRRCLARRVRAYAVETLYRPACRLTRSGVFRTERASLPEGEPGWSREIADHRLA